MFPSSGYSTGGGDRFLRSVGTFLPDIHKTGIIFIAERTSGAALLNRFETLVSDSEMNLLRRLPFTARSYLQGSILLLVALCF